MVVCVRSTASRALRPASRGEILPLSMVECVVATLEAGQADDGVSTSRWLARRVRYEYRFFGREAVHKAE